MKLQLVISRPVRQVWKCDVPQVVSREYDINKNAISY